MITAPTRSKPSVLAYGMLLAVCCTMVTATSVYIQDLVDDKTSAEYKVEKLGGAGDTLKKTLASNNIAFEAFLVRVTIPPCGARTMHIHRDVDEIHYITKGTFTASIHIPSDNSIVKETVTAGQSFLTPANHIHEVINPSCDEDAQFIGFYNWIDPAITNIGAAAYGLADSPFKAYQDSSKAASLEEAVSGAFTDDAACLARCKKTTPPQWNTAPPTWNRRALA